MPTYQQLHGGKISKTILAEGIVAYSNKMKKILKWLIRLLNKEKNYYS